MKMKNGDSNFCEDNINNKEEEEEEEIVVVVVIIIKYKK